MAEIEPLYERVRAGRVASSVFARVLAIIFSAVLLVPSAARADWGFTHWGMTAEQVVSASGGTAHLIALADRKRDDADGWEMTVEGTVHEGSLTLDGGYMFDTHGGGLTCVVYNATGDDVAKLRDGLIALYGRPGKDSEFGPLRTLSWQTPDKIELAINQTPLAAVVSHCAPGR
jgi:hypothetical protein